MTTSVLELPSSVTVRAIADFRQRLSTALAEHDEVVIDAAGLIEFDLSFVQLVHAARAGEGKTLRLAEPAGPAVAALLERAGFLTDPSPADVDFWFHGDLPR